MSKIITQSITLSELKNMAASSFGNLVKAVIDVNKELIALDAELHSDLEALLLENGSRQIDLWGINLYPEASREDFVEFDSVINIRPSHGNRNRGVDDADTRKRIIEIVQKRVTR